uniref:serine/threonine-protein kinase D6PKL2-like n=1 Tax=Erigeron canadensis TaxID=72917 RepID=UPI001CB8CF7C|nr:serine/threonine-protein kinase D6PKL2-like [Erigeron canadensis]
MVAETNQTTGLMADHDNNSPSARSRGSSTTTTDHLKLSSSSRSESPSTATFFSSSQKASPVVPTNITKDAIRRIVNANGATLRIEELRFVQKLGSGDIGSVYLVELKCAEGCMFAAKVMDKEELMNRDKESRAKTELEILEMLDHPFLPSLFASFEVDRWSCLLTEFCPGGDLHILRQRQPDRRFDEAAVRFYASEVVVALEYLHMMGIIYRDLKPENILVRSDGHIMLTDFDLCLKCNDSTSPKLVQGQEHAISSPLTCTKGSLSSCMLPKCVMPKLSCFHPKRKRRMRPTNRPAFDIMAEPVEARSMSFVGTHEYLAPEVVSGEGHGNAVDWWTLGIFVYELFYGVTPFRGGDNEFTLTSILARGLQFPKEPVASSAMKDLITKLLIKDPAKRIGSMKGAPSIKHHSFFDGVDWALLRGASPPYIPQPVSFRDFIAQNDNHDDHIDYY